MRVVGASRQGGACWRGRPSLCPEAGRLPPGGEGGQPPPARPRGHAGGQRGAGWRWGTPPSPWPHPGQHHLSVCAPTWLVQRSWEFQDVLALGLPGGAAHSVGGSVPPPRAQGQPGGLFITSLDSGRLGCFHRLAFCLKLLRTGVDKIVFRSLLSALWGQTLLFWKIMHR